MALKIPQLLVQYLYQYRKLSLPGFGTFILDKSVVLPEENDRTLLSLPNAVQFQNANITTPDNDLISFICEKTGKIKPLAIADLESYLFLGSEMMNIGKPFYLEGIGTLSKNKSGKYDFKPGEYALIRESSETIDQSKKKSHNVEKVSTDTASSNRSGIFLKIVAVIIALLIVGWGGYLMYKKSISGSDNPQDTSETQKITTPKQDTVTVAQTTKDSINPTSSAEHTDSLAVNSYRWVILSTENKAHALKRYRQLLSYDLKAFLFQKDSTYFKVYFQFPALAKDTTRIKDSLKRQYAHDITIEH